MRGDRGGRLNLENSDPPTGEMIDAAEQEDFLAAVRCAAVSARVDLVINAPTDSFLPSSNTQVLRPVSEGRTLRLPPLELRA